MFSLIIDWNISIETVQYFGIHGKFMPYLHTCVVSARTRYAFPLETHVRKFDNIHIWTVTTGSKVQLEMYSEVTTNLHRSLAFSPADNNWNKLMKSALLKLLKSEYAQIWYTYNKGRWKKCCWGMEAKSMFTIRRAISEGEKRRRKRGGRQFQIELANLEIPPITELGSKTAQQRSYLYQRGSRRKVYSALHPQIATPNCFSMLKNNTDRSFNRDYWKDTFSTFGVPFIYIYMK